MAVANFTYSFLDCHCGIVGPALALTLGGPGGVADEGISVSAAGDKSTMVVGADGGGMHSLHADSSGTITIRLLKTSPLNHILSAAFNYQKTTSAYWGQNTIQVSNPVRGDVAVATNCAFKRMPDFLNAKDGGIVEWAFDCIFVTSILGDGTPNAA